jgi:hypothetical protein
MPSKDDHLAQAARNQAFFRSFDTARFEDWAATVLFYAGLHYVDAFLATVGIHPGKHDVRDGEMRSRGELRPIAKDYFFLKNSSRNARYYPPVRFPPDHLRRLEGTHLKRIRTELAGHVPGM